MPNALVPELYVSNIEASLSFYCDRLGFEIVYDRPEERFAYLKLGEAELMLEQLSTKSWRTGTLEPPFGRGLNLQIQVQDVQSVYAACQASTVLIQVPLETRHYAAGDTTITQAQFVVQDPDGYLIRLAEVRS